MSFFGRAANLLKGGFKSVTRPDADPSASARALEEELARLEKRAAPTATRPTAAETAAARATAAGATAAETKAAPERDEHGNVKRTL